MQRDLCLCPNYKNTENYAFGAKNMNDRKKVYYFKKNGDPIILFAYFLMAFSNVVIANSYLFGETDMIFVVFVQYISCILFIVALCTGNTN